MRLKDKVAIVTGASRGIGRAIALLFAKEGAKVVATYCNNKEHADSLVSEMKELGVEAIAVQFDAKDSFSEVVSEAVGQFRRVDILVNNAGILDPVVFEDLDQAMWDKTIGTNLSSVYRCIHEVFPLMKEQKYGKIVNISSIVSIIGSMSSPAYAVSKAGVDGLTKTLAKDFGQYNITINSVAPGLTDTDMVRNNMTDEVIQSITSQTPLGRIGLPDDIAKAVLFFASSDSDFISGQILVVDGGRVVR